MQHRCKISYNKISITILFFTVASYVLAVFHWVLWIAQNLVESWTLLLHQAHWLLSRWQNIGRFCLVWSRLESYFLIPSLFCLWIQTVSSFFLLDKAQDNYQQTFFHGYHLPLHLYSFLYHQRHSFSCLQMVEILHGPFSTRDQYLQLLQMLPGKPPSLVFALSVWAVMLHDTIGTPQPVLPMQKVS